MPGHWESDLLVGARGSSAIITLVERSTRYAMLGALPGGRASEAVIAVLSALAQRLPQHLRRHAEFTVASTSSSLSLRGDCVVRHAPACRATASP